MASETEQTPSNSRNKFRCSNTITRNYTAPVFYFLFLSGETVKYDELVQCRTFRGSFKRIDHQQVLIFSFATTKLRYFISYGGVVIIKR